MNLKLDSNVGKVKFNGNEVDKVKFNGAVVWSKPAAQHIYGVEWPNTTGNDTQVLIRTDDSANFADPDPYVADGNHPGSSPFDNCMPWSGITTETINGNVYVKIPKFWFKFTTKVANGNITKIQIADYPATGFNVSPAHMDKGYGEQDYAYIGRYISGSDPCSKSGETPNQMTRAAARTAVRALGTGYELLDYSALVAIWALYLVEFAHTDSQAKIGYGCRSDSSRYDTGVTDAMPYHTGTMASDRTTYVNGTQYRYIEDLWGNMSAWVDGVRVSQSNSNRYLHAYNTFSEYAETGGGFNCGKVVSRGDGGGSAIRVLNKYDSTLWGVRLTSDQTATITNSIPDTVYWYWSSNTSNYYNVFMGGAENKSTSAGLFYLFNAGNTVTRGFRIQYVPQSA